MPTLLFKTYVSYFINLIIVYYYALKYLNEEKGHPKNISYQ